jgi:acetoin:2,6-dichlorophenolindophenol oxidoreductase subunit alpha
MNLAAIWKLPVIFLCENNLYGEYSPVARTTPIEQLADRAAGYAMPGLRIDGNNVREVFQAVGAAVERARSGAGPTLIEAMTYRHKGHSRTDPGTYRPKEEVEEWLARDPIPGLEAVLLELGVGAERIEEVRAAATRKVEEHRDRALNWADPDPDARFEHVYS